MATSQYFLSNHAFFCRAGHHYVFLDLKADRYWAIARERLEAIGPSLRGWSEGTDAQTSTQHAQAGHAGDIGKLLVERGLLTTDPAAGRAVVPTRFRLPERAFTLNSPPIGGQLGIRHVPTFIIAGCRAAIKRRRRPISQILEKPAAHMRTGPDRFDEDKCRSLVATFSVLRPYFPEKSSCLVDSFMLIEFLARYRIRPHWVFGVRTAPFSAHCWVQHDNLVLNDTPEHVSSFVPIMAV
jgi:hypothetical protein